MPGSWFSLLAAQEQAVAEAKEELQRRPVSCPNDGQLLQDKNGTLWCPYDGWRWRGHGG